ncbi:MAG: hypothetical protein RBT49_04950 [Bacteroidales bacterium]|jgi:hypothetical protein|nr:hypothetical protein [Bacteroidales bacterium]
MKIARFLIAASLVFFVTEIFGQELPATYQPMLNEVIINFKTITSGNSIRQGKTTLSVVNENKIALRIEHQKKVKNLTFITKLDAENKLVWIAANPLTTDMVNKHSEDLVKELEEMLELSRKKAKE